LVSLDQVVREIGQTLVQRQERVRLTTSTAILARYLRQPILQLRQRRPGVEIEIETQNTTEERLCALRDGRADLAMVTLTDLPPSLEVRPYKNTELVLLVHLEHRLAACKRVRVEDLGSIRYIAQSASSGTYRHVERALRAVGVCIQPHHIVEDATNATMMVEAGYGETFVPASLAAELERSHAIKAIKVVSLPPLAMGWAARSFALLPAAATEFIEVCDQLAGSA
jgi:DNA-binding transcriptional LysR family regulator